LHSRVVTIITRSKATPELVLKETQKEVAYMRKNIFMEDKMRKTGFLTVLAAGLVLLFAACKDYPTSMVVIYPRAPNPENVKVTMYPNESNPKYAKVEWVTGDNSTWFEIIRRPVNDENGRSIQVIYYEPQYDRPTDIPTGIPVNAAGDVKGLGQITNSHRFIYDTTAPGDFRIEKKTTPNIDNYEFVMDLEDLLYATARGTPYFLGVRAFSQFDNRWSNYSDAVWDRDKEVTFSTAPTITGLTITGKPLPDETAFSGSVSRASTREFTVTATFDGPIDWATATAAQKAIQWMAYYTNKAGSTAAADTGPINGEIPLVVTLGPSTTIAIGTVTWEVSLYTDYNESVDSKIMLVAAYNGTVLDPRKTDNSPPGILGIGPNGLPIATIQQLEISINNLPPGDVLENNVARPGNMSSGSKYFYFDINRYPATRFSDQFFVRWYNTPSNTAAGIVAPFADVNVYVRFYNESGNSIPWTLSATSSGSSSNISSNSSNEIRIDDLVPSGIYQLIVNRRLDFPSNARFFGIRVEHRSGGATGDFAIDFRNPETGDSIQSVVPPLR